MIWSSWIKTHLSPQSNLTRTAVYNGGMSGVFPSRSLWILVASLALVGGRLAAAESLALRRAAVDEAYRQQLAQIAAKCEELNLAEQARVTRAWFIPRDPARLYVFLPTANDAGAPPADAPAVVRFWHEAWMKARRAQAAALFQLAQNALDRGDVRGAWLLLHETLREDPDHAAAGRLCRSADGEPQPKLVRTPHPRFGWPAGRHWRAVTEHYEIKTSHSPEEGLRLARRLEELRAVWRQVFADYWLSAADLRRALAGGALPGPPRRKLQVVLFRDREEYVRQLEREQPQIGVTEGYYAPADRVAYFFASDDDRQATWFHEGAHQLFYETGPAAPQPGQDANFWAIEAVALYMESLTPQDGFYCVGGWDAERLQYARFRALSEDFYLPLAELTALGRDPLQRHPELRRLYSQAAGLAHFFLDPDDGRRREAFLHFVRAVHQGRDRPETLAQLTETVYPDLDRQYREFLNVTDADLEQARPPASMTMLSLGGTAVTDAGLAHLERYPHLTWLNLAGTRVTDAGLQHVARRRGLHDLYLTGTQVTDRGLALLEGLENLKMLDVTGTQVSPDGWRRLQQALPEVRAAE